MQPLCGIVGRRPSLADCPISVLALVSGVLRGRDGILPKPSGSFPNGPVNEELTMKQPSPPTLERDNDHSLSLVDRMDPAIGEASSVMGAVLTELLRRSLRGGVLKISDELQAFVCDKVEGTLAERTPVIEQQASEVAGNTARAVAAEVAGQEV